MRFSLLLAAVALVIGACTPVPPPPPVDLSSAPCAAEPVLAAAPALVLEADPVAVTLDASTACMRDAEGASLYTAFALPDTAAPYQVSVASETWGDQVFTPRMLLLGADGHVLRRVGRAAFVNRGGAVSALLRRRPGETFLVIASDVASVGHTEARLVESTQITPLPAGPVIVYAHTGRDSLLVTRGSNTGRVRVAVRAIPPPS